VRVDILERLADLIRPALAWKAGTGVRPEGAFDGNAFTVTPAMMSILGAKAEDMEEILKGLGYRAEAKPAAEVTARLEALDQAARDAVAAAEAAKAAAAAQAAEAAEADGLTPEAAEGSEAATPDPANEAEPANGAEPASDVDDAESRRVSASEAITPDAGETAQPATDEPNAQYTDASASPEPAEAAAQGETNDAPEADESAAAQAGGDARSSEEDAPTVAAATEATSTEEAAVAEEPKPILLWRPARFDRGQRHQHHRVQGKGRSQGGNATAGGNPRDERNGNNRRFERKGKPGSFDGGSQERNGNGKRPHNGPGKGKPAFQKPREERPSRFDPDSPFAKLAALRDQLKK
jgi:ATP-dependent RNA helicase SUPV3L1/SUV3